MRKLLNSIYAGVILGAILITNSVSAQAFKPMTDSSAPQAVVEGVYGGKLMKLPVYMCGTITSGVIVPCTVGGGGSGTADSTAANQTTQITAEQLTNTRLGDISSPAAGSANARLEQVRAAVAALGSPYQAGGALPLPTGAATNAAQTTAQTSFSSIVTNTTGLATASAQTTANSSLSSIVTNTTGLATSAAQTTAQTSLSAIATSVASATPAGEAHVGELGGNQLTIQVAQTVTASAYTSGNAVGGLMTLSNAARVSAGSGLLQSVVISTKSAQTTQVDVFIFSANPTGTTCTDKTAFALASADFDKVLGVASVTTWFSGGTPSIGQSQNLAMPYALASGTTLYACAVTRSTPTYASTSDVSVGFRVLRN